MAFKHGLAKNTGKTWVKFGKESDDSELPSTSKLLERCEIRNFGPNTVTDA